MSDHFFVGQVEYQTKHSVDPYLNFSFGISINVDRVEHDVT